MLRKKLFYLYLQMIISCLIFHQHMIAGSNMIAGHKLIAINFPKLRLMFNSESYKTYNSCVFMCTLSLFYILAIAVLYFKERYTVEAILVKIIRILIELEMYEN